MLFSELIRKGFITAIESNTKDEVFNELVYKITEKYEIPQLFDTIIASIEKRESECNTQIKEGLAIPHVRLDEQLPEIIGGIGISQKPLLWGNNEFKSVHIVILLITPKTRANEFLYLLSEVAMLFDKTNCFRDILNADVNSIYKIIQQNENLIV